MAEIEITLPTVQYGNVKLRASTEELNISAADPDIMGEWAAVYLNMFTQGFRKGSQRDVTAPLAASEEAPPGNPQAAADRLADGRSPRTVDEANEMAKQVIEKELGPVTELTEQQAADELTREGQEIEAPWKQEVDAQPKPWEIEVKADRPKPVISSDW